MVLGKTRLFGLSTACGLIAWTGGVPVPVSVVVGGVPGALWATETMPEKLAAEAGVKVTEMPQLAPAASAPPQVVVSAKSAGLAPVMVMLLMVRVALPGFDSVIDCAVAVVPTVVLGKGRLVGLSKACGNSGAVPVLLSVAVCGVLAALSVTETVAEKLAALVGVKVTEMMQLAPAAGFLRKLWFSQSPLGWRRRW